MEKSGVIIMLVLTRRLNQVITIGDHVEVTVVEVRGDQVRLGVSAPRDTAVHRKEIWEQIQAENRSAASNTDVSQIPSLPVAKTERR